METGIFFRIERDGKFYAIDFGEMTFVEREKILDTLDETALRSMIQILFIAKSAQL